MSEQAATAEKPVAPSLKAIIGQKVGMTQIFDAQGRVIPVTVIQAGPCHVTQVLTKESHGYGAIQVAFGAVREKSINKAAAGVFKKTNVTPARWLREIRVDNPASFQVGMAIRCESFAPGDYIDVTGINKGKGFAGTVKRHNFGGGPSTHGQSDRQRAPGSSGSNTYPGRVFKGKKFPGHLGSETTTVQHLEVVEVLPEKDVLLVRGAVPGPNQNLLSIRQTVKRIKVKRVQVTDTGKKAKKEAPKAAAPAAKKGK